MATNCLYKDSPRPETLELGLKFQDFVCTELAKQNIILQNMCSKKYQHTIGENLQGFEIKFDGRCTDTRRLSIEVAEKTSKESPVWTPSGILRNDNSWIYIQGNYEVFFVFSKKWLVRAYRLKIEEITEFNGTIKRFFIPFDLAELSSLRIFGNPNARLMSACQE
jgi:hypothetical protein